MLSRSSAPRKSLFYLKWHWQKQFCCRLQWCYTQRGKLGANCWQRLAFLWPQEKFHFVVDGQEDVWKPNVSVPEKSFAYRWKWIGLQLLQTRDIIFFSTNWTNNLLEWCVEGNHKVETLKINHWTLWCSNKSNLRYFFRLARTILADFFLKLSFHRLFRLTVLLIVIDACA